MTVCTAQESDTLLRIRVNVEPFKFETISQFNNLEQFPKFAI